MYTKWFATISLTSRKFEEVLVMTWWDQEWGGGGGGVTETALHSKKSWACSSTGLNNVVLPTLFLVVNNIEQYCWGWMACNNVVHHCWQPWTMWAAQHCSILFITTLQQVDDFLPCSNLTQSQHGSSPTWAAIDWNIGFIWSLWKRY